MASKKHEVGRGNTLWFPSAGASRTLWVHYSKRGRAIELTAMGNTDYYENYRIPLAHFLNDLGITVDVVAEVLR